ncbi:MAG: HAD-IC family P-type ATPase [Acholeplasmataceae bacterium]|nr:HAD-IC family P-type ATPase [Acholeplasmataceae bacterium]
MEHLKKNENTEKKQTLDSEPKKEENKSKNIKNKTADDPGKDILEALKKKKVINLAAEEEAETEEAVEEEQKKKGKQAEEEIKYPRYYDTDLFVGLTSEIVEQRKEDNLVNKVSDGKGKTVMGIIFSNFFTFFNMLYFVITILFIVLKSYDNLMFLTTIIPNLIIGIIQEIKAKRMMDKLSLMSAPTTTVIRDGEKLEIPVSEIVLDDIIFYTAGKQICADSIVLEGFIEVNESLLTGEADAILKQPGDLLLSGSFVVSGMAVARVDKVGKDNYIEKLSKDAKMYLKPRSEILRSLNGIIKFVSLIIIPLAVMTYLTSSRDAPRDYLGFLNKQGIIKAASSMLAMIPAGLFLLTSMALFVSVIRLARVKTLVQELYCIEMLARVNMLCLDKTGTITDGTMRVTDCIEIKNPTDYTIREIIGSMMQTFEETNPTADALINYFEKNTVLKATDKIPFSSKRKFSAVTFGDIGTFVLGAPEFVLTSGFDRIAAKVERYAAQGNRVLLLGLTKSKVKPDETPRGVTPVCLIILEDHIRDDAIETIEYFKQNGVDIKVISGDNPVTVSKIALRAGIEGAERYISLAGLTDDEVRDSVFEYNVFGRVSPEQKRILIKTLKEHKKTVAMTGDGVNDILALKEADCSIAMASGSEAARYVSHLVLMDSNFSSIPRVVQEGRRVINNIQKTSTLYLVKTLFSILLTIMYIILGTQTGAIRMPYPFSAKNLYLIEWFAIGIPSFFLALQPNRELVQGKFLPNVVKSVLPGALTVVILHLLLNFIRILPGFEGLHANNAVFTTILTIVTTAVMLFVLMQSSQPLNWWRKTIFVLMIICCFLVGTNTVPVTNMELTFRRGIEEYDYTLTVGAWEEWYLNGMPTEVKAILRPEIEFENQNTYLRPVISTDENNVWCLDGIPTGIKVRDVEKLALKVEGGYWVLNGTVTKTRAYNQPEIEYSGADGYICPELTIYRGYWRLDGISSGIKVTGVGKNMILSVKDGNWHINGEDTDIKAKEIINENEYVLPEITKVKFEGDIYYALDGVRTNVLVDDEGVRQLQVSENGYWIINGIETNVKAEKNGEKVVDDDYLLPIVDIDGSGNYTINNIRTSIKAENNLYITEIFITLFLVQLIYPLMKLISLIMKKLRLSN